MNIFLINHYAGSPEMGMEYRPYYLAKEWIKQGHTVTILAATYSHIRHTNPDFDTEMTEQNMDGIHYVWIKTPTYQGNGIARVKNMFEFIRKTLYKSSFFAKKYKPDIVIASSTYPSDNYVARKIAKLSKAKYIYEVHDLWPLSPMELGKMNRYHPFIIAMQHAENFAYRKADAVISLLPKTKEYMISKGLNPDKWHYVPNGIVVEDWKNPKSLNEKTKNDIIHIKNQFNTIVAYTGTFGLANALFAFILAGKQLKDIAFVLVGKGPEKQNLQDLIDSYHLTNVFILDNINKHEIPSLLKHFDILYIGLQSQSLFRFGISPNKMIDYMMAGKPIIQAIKAGNNMVEEAQCGIAIEPENPQAIVNAIKTLFSLPKNKIDEMGKNGQKFVLENHDYSILAKNFETIMLNL